MTLVKVTLTTDNGPVETCGETTASPYLFVTPHLFDGRFTGDWSLVHGPTGRLINWPYEDLVIASWPRGRRNPSELRKLAAKVAHLDWSSSDKADFGAEFEAAYKAAAR
jgi:hypothetical protein